MKKFLVISSAILVASALSFSACGNDNTPAPDSGDDSPVSVTVVSPDGAPALALGKLMNETYSYSSDYTVDYEVVDSSTISTYVTGEAPKADLCVLPVNAASKLLKTGEKYQMLGAVTHGNLYLLSSKDDTQITDANIATLKGKTVGVVNLANVPGLVFKSILSDKGVEYSELGNEGVVAEDKVNLKAIDGTAVGTLADVDYYVAPEPAASAKVKALSQKNGLAFVGDLQKLYGENGYVQAVLVAKTSFIAANAEFTSGFLKEMIANESWLSTSEASVVVETVSSHLTEGLTPSFNANNLTSSVISNCGIRFDYSVECKDETNAIIEKFISLNANSASKVEDAFFNLTFKRA